MATSPVDNDGERIPDSTMHAQDPAPAPAPAPAVPFSSDHLSSRPSRTSRIVRMLFWEPKWVRWNPDSPTPLTLPLNLLFGFAACFTVANLYYSHPILNDIAISFGVSQERASLIPTLMQAGYAVGLIFLCPLGDIIPRRPMTLIMVFATATLWIGLCITTSFNAFLGLSFLTAVTTVTPQVMVPLVGGLAHPHRRASAISIVVTGLLLGILVARVLSGVVAQFTPWRNIYWLSLAVQYFLLVLLWLFMPDYPSVNPEGINYVKMLWSIATITVHEPVLVQASAIGFLTAATWTSYWTTLTFLLNGPPFYFSTLVIGLFALIGVGSLSFSPLYSRFVMDRYVPLMSCIFGEFLALLGICLGTYLGSWSLSGPILEAFLLDLGFQLTQISNRSCIYALRPQARNRINTAYTVSVFVGQLMGTAVGNRLYAEAGWVASGSANVAFSGLALVVCFVRGPWEEGWIGWRGGWGLRPEHIVEEKKAAAAAAGASDEEEQRPAGGGGEAGAVAGAEAREGSEPELEKEQGAPEGDRKAGPVEERDGREGNRGIRERRQEPLGGGNDVLLEEDEAELGDREDSWREKVSPSAG